MISTSTIFNPSECPGQTRIARESREWVYVWSHLAQVMIICMLIGAFYGFGFTYGAIGWALKKAVGPQTTRGCWVAALIIFDLSIVIGLMLAIFHRVRFKLDWRQANGHCLTCGCPPPKEGNVCRCCGGNPSRRPDHVRQVW